MSDGSLALSVRAKDDKTIAALARKLRVAGYAFKTGRIATSNSPLGYVYGTSVTVSAKPAMKIDLTSVKPPRRPRDDVSAQGGDAHDGS